MWTIRNYLHDLSEFYAGDTGRFSRMVVDGGKSLPTAHPGGWVQHIVNCTPDVIEFYPSEVVAIYEQLSAWGHDVKIVGKHASTDSQFNRRK